MNNDPSLDSISYSGLKRNNIYLIVFVLILLIFITHSIYLSVIAEDAFISFQYANNLVNGFGLVWNIGDPPVEGYTNFLWVMLCSIGLLLNLELITFSQLLGILSSVITLIYVYKIGKKILGFKTKIALIPCLMLAVSGPFATWASSGMETNLFTLFIVGSVYYELSFVLSHKRSSLSFLFLFMLLAALTRPEGFGFFLILFVLHLIKAEASKSS
ncbi:MAG: glycosyltransferase family 39 protein, partial [Ignavibacteriaceae bacterium]